jgi:predicted neuraminidase
VKALTEQVGRWLGAGLIVAVTAWAAWPGLHPAPAPGFVLPSAPTATASAQAPQMFSALINAAQPPRVHAASITERLNGTLYAVWYGGSREGAADVALYSAHTLTRGGKPLWDKPSAFFSPRDTTQGTMQWVRKLGNPVVFTPPEDDPWLIYVSATLGGWATSQLNMVRPYLWDNWFQRPIQRLVTSPFFNMSTLVKGAPVYYDNGDIGLPVYHEMAGKFAELLVLTPAGEVRRKIRLDEGRRTLQPVVVVEDATHAIALMRDASGNPPRVWRSETTNAGRDWSVPQATDLPNPNSALSALRLDDGRLLAIANDTEDERLRLSLLVSDDRGQHWRAIHRFEDKQAQLGKNPPEAEFRAQLAHDIAALGEARPAAEEITANVTRNMCRKGECGWQYDYPYLIRASNGDFHLVYTWNQSFVRHVQFNSAWLQARLEAAP